MSSSLGPCQRRQQQQDRLLNEAASHGSYLWHDRDVENALLWFPRDNAAKSGDNTDEKHEHAEGCDFLRVLLQARGVWMRRPAPRRSRRSHKQRKSTSGGSQTSTPKNASHVRRDAHEPGTKRGRTRSREKTEGKDGTRKSSEESPATSLLQAVITGYYQCFFTSTACASSDTGHCQSVNDSKQIDATVRFTARDCKHVEMASSKLLGDLTAIVSARSHTHEIHRAFHNVVHAASANADAREKKHSKREFPQIIRAIDEYMTHPTTCARRVYASSLLDRLFHLCRDAGPVGATHERTGLDGIDDEKDDGATVQHFLRKLMGLSVGNAKIQEVILLLLLEPARRLQWERQKEPLVEKSQELSEKNGHHSKEIELYPLLISLSVHAESIERVYSRAPLPTLVQFILQSSPRNKHAIHDDDNLLSSSAGNKHKCTQTLEWWSHCSPLLCTVSQWYFPIACTYITFLIQMAAIDHGKLYDGAATGQQQSQSEFDRANINSKESFHCTILRIQEFCSTSERLRLLARRVFYSMESTSQEALERSSALSEERKNAAFQKRVALKAICRYAFEE